MVQKTGSMTFRVEDDLQAAFVAACKKNDVTAAQVLRGAMRDYLARNAQATLPLAGGVKTKGKTNAKG
jgi:predicted transcriptional regulator